MIHKAGIFIIIVWFFCCFLTDIFDIESIYLNSCITIKEFSPSHEDKIFQSWHSMISYKKEF